MIAKASLAPVLFAAISMGVLMPAAPAAGQPIIPNLGAPGEPCGLGEFAVTTPPGVILPGSPAPWTPPFLAGLRMGFIEVAVDVTEAQRPALDALKTAFDVATSMVRAACPKELPLTPTGRMEAAEKLNEASLQAIRLVRPALDAFYALLTDEQKARFNALIQSADAHPRGRDRDVSAARRRRDCPSTAETCECYPDGCVGLGRRPPDAGTMPYRNWRDDDPGAYLWR